MCSKKKAVVGKEGGHLEWDLREDEGIGRGTA